MSRLTLPLAIALISSVAVLDVGVAGEAGRIKPKPPDAAEAERIASNMVMDDSLLQKGDIVVTDSGYFAFRVGSGRLHYEVDRWPTPQHAIGSRDRLIA